MRQEPAPSGFESGRWLEVIVAWILVGVPLLWGVMQTLEKARRLFE